jgi:hypothetical protein
MNQHGRQGIALIASLFILVAVFVFGVGSIFLARSNLGLATSQQAHAIAKSAAEAGMDAVLIGLNAAGAIPTSQAQLTVPTLSVVDGPAVTYQVVSYVPSTASVRVSVLGTAPRGGRYQTDAVLVPVVIGGSAPGVPFPIGLVSEQGVDVKKVMQMTNSTMHANTALRTTDSLDNIYRSCNDVGQCTTLTGTNRPVSASPGATCSLDSKSHSGICSSGTVGSTYVKPPVTVGAPPIDTVIAEAFNRPLPTSATDPLCGQVVNGRTLQCLSGGTGTTYTSIAGQSNADIVVFGNARIKGSYTGVNLLTIGGHLDLDGPVTVRSSTLVSGMNITQRNELNAGLKTTIAARGTIDLTGNIFSITTGTSDPNGVLFMSGGSFRSGNAIEKTVISGSSTERAAVFIWSGGAVTLDNKADLLGGIAAVGNINATSNDIGIYGSSSLIGGFFKGNQVLGFSFGSRR